MDNSQSNISPEPSATNEPRLSIQHLMLWAACVAVYLSAFQTSARLSSQFTPGNLDTAFLTMDGLVYGSGLAAILLLVVRRARGQVFPRHGGEMLWTIVGIQAVLNLIRYPILFLLESGDWIGTALSIYSLLTMVIWAAVYLYAICQAETRRWKVVFIIVVATAIANPALKMAFMYGLNGIAVMAVVSSAIHVSRQLVIVSSVFTAAWIDLHQPHPYPWTHWAGILLFLVKFAGTVFWFTTVLLLNR